MIVTSDIGDILYKDCKTMLGIANIYQEGNVPAGDITADRVIIRPPKTDTPETYWDKSFANINIVVPDKDGKEDITRLQALQRLAEKVLDDHFGRFNGTGYTYEIASNGIEKDADMKCHYVNVKILFKVLNVKL
jgi:hypothetical protein